MAIPIRAPEQIERIARAGSLCRSILDRLVLACRPGIMTSDLDAFARREIDASGAAPLFLNYRGLGGRPPFSGCVCVSINEELVHGVPGARLIRPGDVVSIDLGLQLGGWCADCARTVLVPPASGVHETMHASLIEVLEETISCMGPGIPWSSVTRAAGERSHRLGLTLVEPYAGHGIGRGLHEAPRAPLLNLAPDRAGQLAPDADFILRPGMVLTVEPIVVRGSGSTITGTDGWTVVSADRAVGCHEERMVAIVRGGSRMLTAPPI